MPTSEPDDRDRPGPAGGVRPAVCLLTALGLAVFLPVSVDAAELEALRFLDRSVKVGVRVEVKGRMQPDGSLRAAEVELQSGNDADEELQGHIESIDPAAKQFSLLGRTVRTREKTRYIREPDLAATFDDLRPGLLVKIDGSSREDGTFRADKVRIRKNQRRSDRVKIEGLIAAIQGSDGAVGLTVAGFDVHIAESTMLVGTGGRSRPIVLRRLGVTDDDEDLLFVRDTRLGRYVSVAGEVRVRGELLQDLDLDAAADDDVLVPEITGTLGLAADLGAFYGYATVVGGREFVLRSPEQDEFLVPGVDPFVRGNDEVRFGEAYLQWASLRGITLAVGRQKFSEEREWFYETRNLDAVRALGRFGPFSVDASLSRDLFDQHRNRRDRNLANAFVQVRYDVVDDLRLEGYFLDRNDRTEQDDSPRVVGLRLLGDPGRRFEIWLDAARETGTTCARLRSDQGTTLASGRRCGANDDVFVVRDVRAHALDVGMTFRPRTRLDPSLSVSWARASGEGDAVRDMTPEQAAATTSTSFRQSGLHRNRWKFNGLVSFRYYGEVLDPELANLQVLTAGIGLRPSDSTSIDVIYHDYRQDRPSVDFHEFEIDADPDGVHDDLGREWDLVFGYEPGRRFELRLTAGYFRPGAAFGEQTTAAYSARFQTKFRF